MIIKPQVAFVDDREEQITPLKEAIQKLNAGTIYFNASPDVAVYPEKPIDTIELIFLDLYYRDSFDPFAPAQWVESIVPPNTKYNLIIWSKDTHEVEEVYEVLEELERVPIYQEVWQKSDFDLETFDFSEKIRNLINKLSHEEQIVQDIIFGEIVDIEEEAVLINCRISNEEPVFQVRKFDNDLLKNVSNIEIGTVVKIVMHTKPGSRLIDVYEEEKDMKTWFDVPDFFEGFEDSSFFKPE